MFFSEKTGDRKYCFICAATGNSTGIFCQEGKNSNDMQQKNSKNLIHIIHTIVRFHNKYLKNTSYIVAKTIETASQNTILNK